MTEREEQADRDRPLALLHQLARDVVDRRDVVGVHRVAQAERVGEESGADQHRIIAERHQRPNPRQHVRDDQNAIEAGDLAAQIRVLVVEQPGYGPHAHPPGAARNRPIPPHRYDGARRAGNTL